MDHLSNPRPYEGCEKYIFVSYSHKDSDLIIPIINHMTEVGYRVWYDDGIRPGTEWPEVIAQHLNDCAYFIAFLSNSYMDSFNCKREIDFAVRKRKPFMTVFLEETNLSLGVEMQISTVQSVDYYKTSPDRFMEEFIKLEVLNRSGCRGTNSGETEGKQEEEKQPETAKKKASGTPRKNFKLLIPVLAGVLLILGITGAVIGINVSKAHKKTTGRISKNAIEFTDFKVTDRALKKAAKGKEVRQLKLTNCEISVRKPEVWSEILSDKVSQVTVTGCDLTDRDASAILESTPGLKTLDLSDNQLKELDLSGNPKLQTAELSRNGLKHIRATDLDGLTSIRLDGNELENLDFLERAIHLKTLYASGNNLDNITVLTNCALLTKVILSDNEIEDVKALQAAKESLTDLDLSHNKITDIECLNPMPLLKKLSVDDNQITVLYLNGSEKLSYLSARNNRIDSLNDSFEALTYLDLANNCLSGEYYFQFSTKLKKGFFENNMISGLYFGGEEFRSANLVVYNNPLTVLDVGEKNAYNIYASHNDNLEEKLGTKCGNHLYLLDCPYDLRVRYEKAWGSYAVTFYNPDEMKEKVDGLRKTLEQ